MGSLSLEQSADLRALVRELQPECLISGRLGNDQGDFCVMGDNQYPDYAIAAPWQVPASMYDETWGYRSWQEKVPAAQKAAEKIRSLVHTVARGGNFLLNIGPKGDGSVPEHEQQVLEHIGAWLEVNGEAIYGTEPALSPGSLSYAEFTRKGNILYLHLLETPIGGNIRIGGIAGGVKSVVALDAPNRKLRHRLEKDTLEIALPENFPEENTIRVLRLEMGQFPESTPNIDLIPAENGILGRESATPLYSFSGVDYYGSFRSTVGLRWELLPSESKAITPVIYYSQEEAGREGLLDINGTTAPVTFREGIPFPLPPFELSWGPVFTNGPQTGFIDRPGGDPAEAEPDQPWGGKPWTIRNDWDNNTRYRLPAAMLENWYWLQQITAATPATVLIGVPTNDGVAVYLNGKPVYVGNNPLQEAGKQTTLWLHLEQGENTLLVKSFNRFGKEVEVGVFTNVPQVLYRKRLPAISPTKGEPFRIELRNPPEVPVHRDLGMPNVWIYLE